MRDVDSCSTCRLHADGRGCHLAGRFIVPVTCLRQAKALKLRSCLVCVSACVCLRTSLTKRVTDQGSFFVAKIVQISETMRRVTLPQTNMEPPKEALKEDSSLKKIPCQVRGVWSAAFLAALCMRFVELLQRFDVDGPKPKHPQVPHPKPHPKSELGRYT